jgi:hypothetical protein
MVTKKISDTKQKKEKLYSITLNERQIKTIAAALEVSSRMRCGHLSTPYMTPLEDAIWDRHNKPDVKSSKFSDVSRQVNELLIKIKTLIWNIQPNEHLSLGEFEQSDLEYEMYKVILNNFEKEKKIKLGDNYTPNVHSDNFSNLTKEPKIKIERML